MTELELITFVTPTIGMVVAVLFGSMFFREWKVGRDRDFKYKQEELYLRKLQTKTNKNTVNIENEIGSQGVDLGGYVTIDMPEDRKSLFHDLLKGFEDYASIKGYKVNISIDSSQEGKLSFKIVVNDFGVVGTRESVKKDLNEFIDKIKNGEPLDDLHEVVGEVEHARLLMALKNRVVLLQSHYEVQKNINEYYKSFFLEIPTQSISHSQPIHIYNGEQQMDQRKYIAKNSANTIQGDNNSSSIEGNDINIGSTFSEKNKRIEGLGELIELLKSSTVENKENALRHLENTQEELTEEETPNESTIEKWLGKASKILKLADKGSELFSKAKQVYDDFGIEL